MQATQSNCKPVITGTRDPVTKRPCHHALSILAAGTISMQLKANEYISPFPFRIQYMKITVKVVFSFELIVLNLHNLNVALENSYRCR